VKRISPQPVVSVRPLVTEKTSARRQGHRGARTDSLGVTPRYDGPRPTILRTYPHTGWNSIRSSLLSVGSPATTSERDRFKSIPSKQLARDGEDRCRAETSRTQSVPPASGPVICPPRDPAARAPHETPHGLQIPYSSPYFSSSLTLSIRGAVSPARHVLTRPRPHPFSRQRKEGTSGTLFHGNTMGLKRTGDAEGLQKVSRHGCQPWPQACGVDLQKATTFPIAPHRGNPEDAPGCSVAEHESQSRALTVMASATSGLPDFTAGRTLAAGSRRSRPREARSETLRFFSSHAHAMASPH